MRSLDDNRPGHLSTSTKEASVYLLASIAINASIYFLYRSTGLSAEYPALGSIVPWIVAINFSSISLIVSFSRFAKWNRHLRRTATLDLLTSLIPIALIWGVRLARWGEATNQLIGLIYVLYISAKGFVLVWHASTNVTERNSSAANAWVFTVSFVIYAAVTPWIALSAWPDGDEPHYLLLTHSLVADRDFDLSNNYNQGDYKLFYPPELTPHHALINSHGQEFPIHDVGLSILLVPGYAVGERLGAMLEMNLVSAFLALGLYVLAVSIGAPERSALVTWALFAFTSPLIILSSLVYPEVVGGACSIWAIIAFTEFVKSRRRMHLALAGLALSLLPWLSVRYWVIVAPMLSVIALYIVVQEWRSDLIGKLKSVLVLGLPTALSLIVFVLFDVHYYNTALPNAGYFLRVAAMQEPLFTTDIHVGLLGLFLDRAYGLLSTAPIYIMSIAGALVMLRRQPWVGATMVFVSGAYILFSGMSRFWYGGWSPPARLICVGAVLLAPLASLVISNRRVVLISGALGLFSVLLGVAYTAFPLTRYTVGFTGALSEFIGKHLGFDYGVAFPSMMRGETVDYQLAALWAGLSMIYVWFLVKPGRKLAS
ncbi:MAG: hypothetical protein AABN34_04530 [Acidobacteriota bacterium]